MASDRPPRPPLPPINFAALADALLGQADVLVPQWLPGGVQRVHEYQCGSVSGGAGTSCSVNLVTGRWADFATGEQGGDLVSLYGAAFGLTAAKAAVTLAQLYGLEGVAGVVGSGSAAPPPPRPPPPAPPPAPPAEKEQWRVVSPAPADAPKATFWDYHYQASDIRHVARYALTDGPDGAGDVLYGYVVRFARSDGGKLTKPYNWCISERDGSGKWLSKTWEVPRPLYLPGATLPAKRTVVLVEGERKAEVLHLLLEREAPGVYCVATWAGGANGWKKAQWAWLAGSTVLLWADCDGKREPLSKADEAACLGDALALDVARAAKPLLPEHKQPGMAAMLGIGTLLEAEHGCQVQLLAIPAPLEVADGWDCADAIEADGWGLAQVQGLFATARALPAGGERAGTVRRLVPGTKKINGPAEAGQVDDDWPAWLAAFADPKTGAVRMSRKTVIAALRNDAALSSVLGFNELSGEIVARQAWPWRDKPGPITDMDDLRLNEYLTERYKVPAAPRAALSEAIHTVADARPYHPIRDHLKALVWDGVGRIDKWLPHVLRMDWAALHERQRVYLQIVSRKTLLGMVSRVMEPGCKFDYSLVLEGRGGIGKSTMLKLLATVGAAAYFSDTTFDLGQGKDGFEQMGGIWVYELSEMSAMRRADSEQIKQFISSVNDRYRGSYGRYVQDHPRQVVIVCSTNKRQYLYDTTGNRRFWPVWCERPINVEWVTKWRDQLFAEAMEAWRNGEGCAPTRDEEQRYFVPEQELRLVETTVQAELLQLLTRDGAPVSETGERGLLSVLTSFVTINQLTRALGADPGKSTPVLEAQVRGWLEAQGWVRKRASTGARPWGWARPAGWPAPIDDDDDHAGSALPGTPAVPLRRGM